ncbi:hypothetical protein C2S53_005674 [Perilla frutescens var. hirtella]|uniref:Uncharacterized protein n=1 Tax=Perilla frutescens var. hirtella TaxID=608512 RepID=A0AAD4IV00_PERFH|nr:hypothetical protein C2S53_005674 [Perilla frutescens var. hirtella]
MIDAASGGALVDKTPVVAKALISNMAASSQQFGCRDTSLKMVKEIDAHVNVVGTGNFHGRKYDPYSNSYNPGWRYHPNFGYGNQQTQQLVEQPCPPPQQRGIYYPR